MSTAQFQALWPVAGLSFYIDDSGITEYPIADGTYVVSTSSLVTAINNALSATQWSASLTSTGFITLTRASGASEIIWYSPSDGVYATDLRDALGFTGDSLSATTTAPSRSPYLLRLTRTATSDRQSVQRVGSQVETDNSVYTLAHSAKVYRDLSFVISDNAQTEEYASEYYSVRDFWSYVVAHGLVVRYYPDIDETTSPFKRLLNPMGYQSYIILGDTWDMQMLDGGWDMYWTWSVRMRRVSE